MKRILFIGGKLPYKLPNGCRYVRQNGYQRGQFHNWAIYLSDNTILSIGGSTKKEARKWALYAMRICSLN